MSLRTAIDGLLDAVSPSALIVFRSSENGMYYVLVDDRRLNGRPFERVGSGASIEHAAAKCLERWNRATPAEVWEDPEG